MIQIKAFKTVRPKPETEYHFPVISLDSLSENQINLLINSASNNYVKMVNPLAFSSRASKKKLLEQIRENYNKLKQEKDIITETPAIYIYEITLNNSIQFRGIVCLTSINDSEKSIKIIHKISKTKIKNYSKYMSSVGIQAEPILLAHHENSKLNVLIEHEIKNKAILNFLDKYQTRHRIWKIENPLKISQFKDVFNKQKELIIIDGANRFEASKINAKIMKKQDEDYTGNEPYNYVSSFLISSNQLSLYDYVTLVKKLNINKDEFLEKICENFIITPKNNMVYYPTQKYHISMYLFGEFYSLYVKKEVRSIPLGIGDIDFYLLDKLLLNSILDKDNNISNFKFIKGNGTIQSSKLLKSKVDSNKYDLGFAVLPTSINELKTVASENQIIPHYTFYQKPKLLTGLLMFDILN